MGLIDNGTKYENGIKSIIKLHFMCISLIYSKGSMCYNKFLYILNDCSKICTTFFLSMLQPFNDGITGYHSTFWLLKMLFITPS